MNRALRPHGGASALWEDLQALAVLQSAPGASFHRTRTHRPPAGTPAGGFAVPVGQHHT